jgi:hypothetical protein
MTNWLLITVDIPNLVIILYWISLGISLILTFVFGLRYHAQKIKMQIKESKDIKKAKINETQHSSHIE